MDLPETLRRGRAISIPLLVLRATGVKRATVNGRGGSGWQGPQEGGYRHYFKGELGREGVTIGPREVNSEFLKGSRGRKEERQPEEVEGKYSAIFSILCVF